MGLGVGKCGGFGDGGSRKCGGFDGVVGRLAMRVSARAPRVSWLVVWAPDSGSAGLAGWGGLGEGDGEARQRLDAVDFEC